MGRPGGRAGRADRLAARQAVAACLHVYEPETGDWNVRFVSERFSAEPVVLLAFARRSRGLLVAPDNPRRIFSVADLAGKRVAVRQPKVGGRALFDHLTRLIVEKLLLDPTEQLKALPDEETQVAYTEAVNRLFRLRDEGGSTAEDGTGRGVRPAQRRSN